MMKLSELIWNHGLGQLPTATGRITPDNPYANWSGEVEKLESENDALMGIVSEWCEALDAEIICRIEPGSQAHMNLRDVIRKAKENDDESN